MKMYVIDTDGKYTVNPTEDPHYSDMVVCHTDNGGLKIEAPCKGKFSTEPQRKTVNSLAGEWLESKMSKPGPGTAHGKITIREGKSVDDGVEIHFITASIDGALSRDEAVAGAGLIGDWVGKTGKKDTAKKPAPAATTAKPAANPAPAPAADTKATPPTTDSKPADTKATPPAANPAPAPVAPATKSSGVHWDPNLSVDENIERLWNAG